LEAAYPRPESDEVYFLLGVALIYSDGRGTSTILVDNIETGEYAYSAQWYNGQFYFVRNHGFDRMVTLTRAEGPVTFPITIPGGALLLGDESAVVLRDHLYLLVHQDVGSDHVFRFDGVGFEDVFTIPVFPASPTLANRDGKLVITPSMLNDGIAYEYDPLEVITIRTPDEEHFEIVRKSATCYHVWSLEKVDTNIDAYQWYIAIERINATCETPVPPGSSTSVIPEGLSEYQRLESLVRAPERDWCWTDIDIDWIIDPLCLHIPCPIEEISTSLSDNKGTVWQKTFDKPFSTTFPFDDKQPYVLSAGIKSGKKIENFLILESDLVNKGIESVDMDFYPQEDYFYFTVSTDKGVKVPLMLSLLGKSGETLWERKFEAPLDEIVKSYVSKPGALLKLSVQTKAVVKVYPNPATDKVTIDTKLASTVTDIYINDLQGALMLTMKALKPGTLSTLDISGMKSGLYVLTIVEGKTSGKILLKVK
jgi:hypothetical protein